MKVWYIQRKSGVYTKIPGIFVCVFQVEIVAIITGHGSDENGCGEFCPTSHHFVVNGIHENMRNFSTAGRLSFHLQKINQHKNII